MHRSHIPLQKWFLGLCLVLNAKKSLSNRQLGRDLGLPSHTVWSFAKRIREAMAKDPMRAKLFTGIVEMDETYVGRKPRRYAKSKRGRGTKKMPIESKNNT